jgi:hypothetical protein
MLQIGELIGDLIQAFGFHWRSFPDPVSIVAIIPAAAPAPTCEGSGMFPMPAGIPYDRARLVARCRSLPSE